MKTPVAANRSRGTGNRRTIKRPVSLIDALFSRTQQRVLGLLFGQPERGFFTTELISITRAGSGAVQRELAALTDSGLVVAKKVGTRRYFQANQAAPVFEELRSIMLKTIGAADPLKAALGPLAPHIKLALLYGSVAKGQDTASSDLDVLVVSDELMLEQLYAVTLQAEGQLSRKVNATLYSERDFQDKRKDPESFVNCVLAGRHIILIGSTDGLAAIG